MTQDATALAELAKDAAEQERRAEAYKALLRQAEGAGYITVSEWIEGLAALAQPKPAEVELLREALEELKLWRMLVNEGGVPRYTVTPGAALNNVVTSTDVVIRRIERSRQP